MNNLLKLSIITINLNNAVGLEKTIKSVVSQTFKDFEYIVIDGGSTDGSVEIIKKHKDKITYWISEPDTGIYNAMNKGILKAKGKYCQFLNSGDCLASNDVLEKMLSIIPSCGIIFGNMIKLMPNGRKFIDRGPAKNDITMLIFYRGTLNHSAAYIKRELFEKYGLYDEELKIVSDWKFYLISVGINNEKVVYKDIHVTKFDMNGISNSNSSLDNEERRKVLNEYLPVNILKDYDNYWSYIEQMKRLNRYFLTKYFVRFIERCLFKYEKFKLSFFK